MSGISSRTEGRLAAWTAWAALAELIVLRMVTRTLIHIPGLADFEAPIGAVSEAGRFAYYVTVVLLVGLMLVLLVGSSDRPRSTALILVRAGIATILLWAFLGRVGVIDGVDVGGLALGGFIVMAAGIVFVGWRALPVLVLVVATYAIGSAATLQLAGGGLSGESFGMLMRFGEITAVTGCLLLPMVLGGPLSKRAIVMGLGATAFVTAVFSAASPTLTILILWSFGLPASLPAAIYGLVAGSVVAVTAQAFRDGRRGLAAGVLLAMAGGVGLISTYQTALSAAGFGLIALNVAPSRGRNRGGSPTPDDEEASADLGRDTALSGV